MIGDLSPSGDAFEGHNENPETPSGPPSDDAYAHVFQKLKGLRLGRKGQWSACCPSHDDEHQSLSLKIGRVGELLVNCHASHGCTFDSIRSVLGLPARDFFPNAVLAPKTKALHFENPDPSADYPCEGHDECFDPSSDDAEPSSWTQDPGPRTQDTVDSGDAEPRTHDTVNEDSVEYRNPPNDPAADCSPPSSNPNQEHQEHQEHQDYQDYQDYQDHPGDLDTSGSLGWDRVEKAARRTALTFGGPKEINMHLFAFARHLKGHCPDASASVLQKAVECWLVCSAAHLGDYSRDEILTLFLDKWKKVRKPVREEFEACVAKAKAMPEIASRGYSGKIGLLVRICVALQEHAGEGNKWVLGCELAGGAIGRDWSTAAVYLKKLVTEGVLELVTPYRFVDGIASEYRLKPEPFPDF